MTAVVTNNEAVAEIPIVEATPIETPIVNRYGINLVRKPRIAEMLACSPRQVDNYLAQGMPHHKPSPRKVTFDSQDVLKWYKEQFGLQRRKSLANN